MKNSLNRRGSAWGGPCGMCSLEGWEMKNRVSWLKAKKYQVDTLMMFGIATVFMTIGLAMMTKKERKKEALRLGVPEDEIVSCEIALLLPLIKKQIEKEVRNNEK